MLNSFHHLVTISSFVGVPVSGMTPDEVGKLILKSGSDVHLCACQRITDFTPKYPYCVQFFLNFIFAIYDIIMK